MHYKIDLLFLFLLFLFARIAAQPPNKQLVVKGRVADSITAAPMIRQRYSLGGKGQAERRIYTDSLGYFTTENTGIRHSVFFHQDYNGGIPAFPGDGNPGKQQGYNH